MKIAREEIFGPVLSVFSWRDEEATIELANSVEYGLTAAVWTNDIKRALKAARRVQSGMVWVNGVGNHFKGTPYGLQAAVWTADISKAIQTARALRAGTVHVNQYDGDDITVPFGGYKQSGNGRDKSLHAFDKYTELKTTWIQIG